MLRNSLVGPAVVCALLLTGLAGCIANQDEAATAGPEPDSIPMLGPGDAQRLEGMSIQVGHPVPLPDRYASEPSIAVADDGTIAVAAPAGSSFSPTLHLHGGYVWISTDGGKSFELKLDPRPPAEAPTAAACSCDTDVTAIGNEIFATTMYWTVNPFFNANIVSSKDKGQNWELRNPMAADKQPIDRQWISPGPNGELLLTYSWTVGREFLLGGQEAIFQQQSTDGGQTWGEPNTVVQVTDHINESFISMKPTSISPSTILVPFIYRNTHAELLVSTHVAVSHDGGKTFTVKDIDKPHDYRAYFHYSIDSLPNGRVIAVWAKTHNETGTETLFMRQSQDFGETWSSIQPISIPGNVVQPWIAWRDDGVLAIAYYGSDDATAIQEMSDKTPWSPRVAILQPQETIQIHELIVNLTGLPTFYGRPCNGRLCAGPEDSTETVMREFLSAEWYNDSLYIAYIDASAPNDVSNIPIDERLVGQVLFSDLTVTRQ